MELRLIIEGERRPMAIWNKHFWNKYPDVRVDDPDGAEDTFWVDMAKVHDHLADAGRKWGDKPLPDPQDVQLLYSHCSDVKGSNVMRVRDQGWFTITSAQARILEDAKDAFDKDE